MPNERRPSGINIIRKRGDIVENTLGRVGSIVPNIFLGTPESILKSPAAQTEELIKERFKDVPWSGSIDVYLGHSPLFRQLKRLFQKERRTNIFGRILLGIPTTISAWIRGKLFRSDLYNPWGEYVQVYHSRDSVAAHEVGHAEDYDQAKHPTLKTIARTLPIVGYPIAVNQEWRASHNAIKHLKEEERPKAATVLTPAFGSYLAPFAYIFNPIFNLVPLLAGHLHSRISKNTPFLHPVFPERKQSPAH